MKKNIFALFVLLLIFTFSENTFAQSEDGSYLLKVQCMAFPAYPISALATGISGDVIVEVEIDKNGEVIGTKMLVGHKWLKKAVDQILSVWKFSSGEKNEKQIFTFTFSIIPQGIPNIGITATFEMPNKITIFGTALKDSIGIPLKANVKKKID